MSIFYYLRVAYYSFFSKELYRDVCFNWRGLGLKYLILLSFISIIPYMLFWYVGINKVDINKVIYNEEYDYAEANSNDINYYIRNLVTQLPTIIIKEGKISLNAEQPYYVVDTEGKTIIAFDTTGKIKSINDTDAQVLVKQDIIQFKLGNENPSISIADFTKVLSNHEEQEIILSQSDYLYEIEFFLSKMKTYFPLIVIPFLLIQALVGLLYRGALYSVLAFLYFKFNKKEFPYTSLLRVAVVSLTPSVIFMLVAPLLALISAPISGLVLSTIVTFLSVGYFIFALNSCQEKFKF